MKYKIKKTTDGLGDEVSVWHGDQVGQFPEVAAMYLRATTYLLDRGWAMAPFGLVTNNHNVIWVENSADVPMGGVVYEYHPHNKQGYIVLIFVDEEYKGRRLYSVLQRALEDEIIRQGGTSIASMAHKDNEARLKAGEREGMTPQFHRLYKDLTPILEERKQVICNFAGKPWDQISKEKWSPVTGPGGRT